MLKFIKGVVYIKKGVIFVLNKQIEIMTTQEIYKLASEITAQEIQNILGGWKNDNDLKSINLFETLVKLGDSESVAVFTVIAEKHNAVEVSEMYNIAYKS